MKSERQYLFMEISYERKVELEKIVVKFCKDNNLNLTKDIVAQLKSCGFSVHKTKFNKPIDGMILVDEDSENISSYNSNKMIFYDVAKDVNAARFIIAHEFAHYISKKTSANNGNIWVAARDHSVGNYSDNEKEQEKDYMAAVMLLPSEELQAEIEEFFKVKISDIKSDKKEKNKIIEDTYFIEQTGKKYRVEKKLVSRRINELFMLNNSGEESA